MTDPDKVTLAECIAWCEQEAVGWQGLAGQTPMGWVATRCLLAILSHLRTLQGVEAGTHVVVPVEEKERAKLAYERLYARHMAARSARPGAPE